MGKKSSKKNIAKQKIAKAENKNTVTYHNMTADELKNIIVTALCEYEQEKRFTNQEITEKTVEENVRFLSKLRIVLCMPFARRTTIKGNETVKILASSLLASVFGLFRIICLAMTLLALATIGVMFATDGINSTFVLRACFLVMTALISYLFAGIFHRVSVEIDNITDESLLIAFFAAVGTWISIFIAAIALFK